MHPPVDRFVVGRLANSIADAANLRRRHSPSIRKLASWRLDGHHQLGRTRRHFGRQGDDNLSIALDIGSGFLTHSRGGCLPVSSQLRRATTRISRFSFSFATVALPVGVSPSIVRPPSIQRKCWDQTWRRGLKRRTLRPVRGSSPCVWFDLNSLHLFQANHRFARIVRPPCDSGQMWSTSISMPISSNWHWQYPHCCRASASTWRRTAMGMGVWLTVRSGRRSPLLACVTLRWQSPAQPSPYRSGAKVGRALSPRPR